MNAPVRAHHIGSLLRPRRLRQAFGAHRDGSMSDEEFRLLQDDAIREVVALQEEIGLRLVTDGEFRRPSYWAHFVAAIDGLEVKEAVFEFKDESGDRMAFTAPHVAGRVTRNQPISVDELVFLQKVTSATPKITMPSPSTMHFWRGPAGIESSAYGSLEEFYADLVAIYREEIAELAKLGGTYIQLDEVSLAMLCDPDVRAATSARGEDPDALVRLYTDAIRQAGEGRPAGVTLAMHLCRGNYKGHWLSAGGYEPVAEAIFSEAGVDVLLLEFDSSRAGDFQPLRHVTGETQVVIGVVSSKTPELESRDDLLRTIEEAAKYMPVERLGLSPQCGFASTVAGNPITEDDEKRKLALVVEVAQEVWGTA